MKMALQEKELEQLRKETAADVVDILGGIDELPQEHVSEVVKFLDGAISETERLEKRAKSECMPAIRVQLDR